MSTKNYVKTTINLKPEHIEFLQNAGMNLSQKVRLFLDAKMGKYKPKEETEFLNS